MFRLVNIGDIHFESAEDPISDKGQQIGKALSAESSPDTHYVLLFNGDFAYSGAQDQFEAAGELIKSIAEQLPKNRLTISLVPGNHDCDFSADMAARSQLMDSLKPESPAESIQEIILSPLENYFNFVDSMSLERTSISRANPFFNQFDITNQGQLMTVTVLNSSWMSDRHEQANAITFPLNTLMDLDSEISRVTSAVLMHHPLNWFRQPDTMRQLTSWIEKNTDLVLTGHEHTPVLTQKETPVASVIHLEGGALQENTHSEASVFSCS